MVDIKNNPKLNISSSKMNTSKKMPESAKPNTFILFFQRHFYYIVSFEALVVLVMGYGFLVRPKLDAWQNSKEQMNIIQDQNQTSMADYNQQITQLQSMIDAYSSLSSSDVNAINKMLPDNKDVEALFVQIDKIIKSNGLLLSNITINDSGKQAQSTKNSRLNITEKAENEPVSQTLQTMNISMNVVGVSYGSLKNLLAGLENNLRILDVQDIKYNPKGGSVQLNIIAYYLGDQGE